MATYGIRAPDGSAAIPQFSFANDTDCGFYRIGANNVGLSLGGAKVVDFAATGVNFNPGITLGSGTDVLSAYVEGSWTPQLFGTSTAGAQTYTTQIGRYVRLGDLVIAFFNVVVNVKDATTAGGLYLAGLPFNSSAVSGLDVTVPLEVGVVDLNVAGGYYSAIGRVSQNSNLVTLHEIGDNVADAALTAADFGNGSTFRGTAIYRTG